jgi:putative nucleotidyltransferase with HDIG domain
MEVLVRLASKQQLPLLRTRHVALKYERATCRKEKKMKLQLTETEQKIVRTLRGCEVLGRAGKVWAVGGAVRDLLLGKTPKDIDLVTDHRPTEIHLHLTTAGCQLIPDKTAWDHGICRVVSPAGPVDIATLRRDDNCDGRHAQVSFTEEIEEDLARRDLTINAMAARIDQEGNLGDIIDLFGGRKDLQTKTVRFVGEGEKRIREDHLRMVRACRFTALDEAWTIAPEDQSTIAREAWRIGLMSKERIRDEICKALGYSRPSNFFRSLHDCRLLVRVMAPLDTCIGVEQNEYHDETVFDHLLFSLDASTSFSDSILLRLATLLHDIGKPTTYSVGPDGRIHFYKHEISGSLVARDWMRELKFSNKDIEYVTKLVRHHQWRFETDSRDKTIRRWLRDVGDDWRDLITLRCADRKGNMAKKNKPAVTKAMRELIERAEKIIETGEPIFDGDLAINGHDLKEAGFKPGPIYKQIIQDCWSLVLNTPEKNTKERLLDFVRKNHGPTGNS